MPTKIIHIIKRTLSTLKKQIKAFNTNLRKAVGKSDYRRWGNKQSLSPDWDSRTRQIANLIEPGTSVIEFGAGRLILKTYLPETCLYTPSDLVDRGHGTIVCDLNSDPLPEFKSYDVAVFSGVLEYVNDLPRVILHLSKSVNVILASYSPTDTNQRYRRERGWVNDHTSAQFIDIFESASFHCDHTEKWGSQLIYKFTKNTDV